MLFTQVEWPCGSRSCRLSRRYPRELQFVQVLFLQLEVNKGSCGSGEPLEGQ